MLEIGNEEPFKHIIPFYTTQYYKGLYSLPVYPIPDFDKPSEVSEKGYVLPPMVVVHKPESQMLLGTGVAVRKFARRGGVVSVVC